MRKKTDLRAKLADSRSARHSTSGCRWVSTQEHGRPAGAEGSSAAFTEGSCVSQRSPEKQSQEERNMQERKFELTWLRRPRSPTMRCLQAGDPGEAKVSFNVGLQALRMGGAEGEPLSPRTGEDRWPSSSGGQEGGAAGREQRLVLLSILCGPSVDTQPQGEGTLHD